MVNGKWMPSLVRDVDVDWKPNKRENCWRRGVEIGAIAAVELFHKHVLRRTVSPKHDSSNNDFFVHRESLARFLFPTSAWDRILVAFTAERISLDHVTRSGSLVLHWFGDSNVYQEIKNVKIEILGQNIGNCAGLKCRALHVFSTQAGRTTSSICHLGCNASLLISSSVRRSYSIIYLFRRYVYLIKFWQRPNAMKCSKFISY